MLLDAKIIKINLILKNKQPNNNTLSHQETLLNVVNQRKIRVNIEKNNNNNNNNNKKYNYINV
jgi:hypothetical protein